MKKYLLLVEDEKLWERFKDSIDKDINSEIMMLIAKKIEKKVEKDGGVEKK
jgi:hypothetical protein